MNKYLMIIDAQNDFIGGKLGTKEAIIAVERIGKELYRNRGYYDRIFLTLDTHYNDTYLNTQEGKHLPIAHCIQGTDGWNIHNSVKAFLPVENPETVTFIRKNTFGTIHWKNCISNGDCEITIVGFCTDICVITNALILKTFYPEATIKVIADCCAGTSIEAHEAALKVMESCQIEVIE